MTASRNRSLVGTGPYSFNDRPSTALIIRRDPLYSVADWIGDTTDAIGNYDITQATSAVRDGAARTYNGVIDLATSETAKKATSAVLSSSAYVYTTVASAVTSPAVTETISTIGSYVAGAYAAATSPATRATASNLTNNAVAMASSAATMGVSSVAALFTPKIPTIRYFNAPPAGKSFVDIIKDNDFSFPINYQLRKDFVDFLRIVYKEYYQTLKMQFSVVQINYSPGHQPSSWFIVRGEANLVAEAADTSDNSEQVLLAFITTLQAGYEGVGIHNLSIPIALASVAAELNISYDKNSDKTLLLQNTTQVAPRDLPKKSS